ncbi:MAG: glycogen synthase GlgA [Firmicutes bacterium HGW-Firmicutes-13]|nr:MAG: glycogen synthase GlgA [Firmicutes bacterium HGW-Firmicutes-13]
MKILFAASEGFPFVKTGGLGDVIGYLPKELRNQGVDVRVILPKYGNIPEHLKESMAFKNRISVPVGWRNQHAVIWEGEHSGVPFYFIENEHYFNRNGVYGCRDEAERFVFFSRAVLETLPHLDFKPQVLHCHDWHTGMVSVFLKSHYRENSFFLKMGTVFTIHNLSYQGVFPREILKDLLALGDEYFNMDALEFYGQVNFLKGGLVFSDCLTTVSPTYAREIQTPYYGENLDGLLRKMGGRLHGIINGIDYEAYDPMTDPEVFLPYRSSLLKKQENKLKLQEILELPRSREVPVIAFINRLVRQKGPDLIIRVLGDIMDLGVQLVVLGSGEEGYEEFFRDEARRYPRQLVVKITFDEGLSRKIYAGSDMFLMPSLFEPCGISQLIALRYGSIPIVRETGGLKDTVRPFNEQTGEGNGFSFTNINAHDMLFTINRAVNFYRDKAAWSKIMKNAVKGEYSWKRSAGEYLDLYRSLV